MIWLDEELKNPLSGETLRRDSPHSFSDGRRRFPVIEEIPFLRANRDELNALVLEKLDAGDRIGALVLLLRDRDDWAGGEPPSESDLQPLFERQDLTLRDAMQCLKYGAVADYFAYRWSDPTFLSGLCLLENHLPPNAEKVFELCCGIGHYLREFSLRGIEATGADVVFSKLWLARRFVAPVAKLICLDANFPFPFLEKVFDAAFCHDAFYFLPKKSHVAAELQRVTDGALLIGHAHNAEAENFSSGAAVSVRDYAAMFENPILYDDADLTRSLIENRVPDVRAVKELIYAEAIAITSNKQVATGTKNFGLPLSHRKLRLNPLLDDGDGKTLSVPQYPSERYATEYAPLSNYLNLDGAEVSVFVREKMSRGLWESDEKSLELARRRIFLDLPENW